jgi:hypothetical protein
MIKLTHTTDMNIVKSLLVTPEIWEQAAEDGVNKDDYYPAYDNLSAWLLCELDDEIIGLIFIHNESLCSINMHPYLKRKYKRKGRDMMIAFFNWFLTLPAGICKVNVSIPFNRKIVYNFAKRVGFKDEGINRMSYLKGGVNHDQYQLGLTRDEIKGLL